MKYKHTTTHTVLLSSENETAKLVLKWAQEASSKGGSFFISVTLPSGYSEITINWPEKDTDETPTSPN